MDRGQTDSERAIALYDRNITESSSLLVEYLSKICTGEVRVVLYSDAEAALSQLESSRVDCAIASTIAVREWTSLPDRDTAIEDTLRSLAAVTLAIWPAWYGQQDTFLSAGNSHDELLANQLKIRELQKARQEICTPWLKAAVKACQSGKPPILSSFPRGMQFAQLALAINPDRLVLVLVANDLQPSDDRLLGLARAATWFAKETRARVAVLLPKALSQQRELDSILYGAIALPDSPREGGDGERQEETKHAIWPIQGKPHPFSPGEKLLAERLARDPELGGLFHCNESVLTTRGSRFLVDLVWPEGKVAVEVDGYRYHSNRFAFSEDRQRDYELVLSGYVVLRLPHDEVMDDVVIATEKIRDFVRFRHADRSC
ncbi:endonuclease domain-containing protein [Synechococcus sp. PCC 7336]|uniref:endonuclease domain-containing protein n=1 Tax=Synechococcus sp. PCC 7336 TaxID=195250 RepID=UPI0003476BD8|nr:DUF559 domain-containing protein [Synechococcus sp. PCC 7336]